MAVRTNLHTALALPAPSNTLFQDLQGKQEFASRVNCSECKDCGLNIYKCPYTARMIAQKHARVYVNHVHVTCRSTAVYTGPRRRRYLVADDNAHLCCKSLKSSMPHMSVKSTCICCMVSLAIRVPVYLAMATRASTAIITCTMADIGAMVAVMAARQDGWIPTACDVMLC